MQRRPVFYKNRQIINRKLITGPGKATGFVQEKIPSWNTLGRPVKKRVGTIGFNLETNNLEYWDGSRWLVLPMEKI